MSIGSPHSYTKLEVQSLSMNALPELTDISDSETIHITWSLSDLVTFTQPSPVSRKLKGLIIPSKLQLLCRKVSK